MRRGLKSLLCVPLRALFRSTRRLRENFTRINAFASLSADLVKPLPASVVVLGKVSVYGTGNIFIGKDALLYPGLHLETQEKASIVIGNSVVISRGAHIVAFLGIEIGDGSMIGEYASLRDANHDRKEGVAIRYAGHRAKPIRIGKEVWIGRGVTVLPGITIGDNATVGANAVVTHDVAPGDTVAGVPAVSIRSRVSESPVQRV